MNSSHLPTTENMHCLLNTDCAPFIIGDPDPGVLPDFSCLKNMALGLD
jgi:hypothetical protein